MVQLRRKEIEQLEETIATLTEKLRHLERQIALLGSLVDFKIVHEKDETEQALAKARDDLERLRAGPSPIVPPTSASTRSRSRTRRCSSGARR